jgi:uncharacterized OsmC-like protein
MRVDLHRHNTYCQVCQLSYTYKNDCWHTPDASVELCLYIHTYIFLCLSIHLCDIPLIIFGMMKRAFFVFFSNNKRITDGVSRHPHPNVLLFASCLGCMCIHMHTTKCFLTNWCLVLHIHRHHMRWKAIRSLRLTLRSDNWKKTLCRHACFFISYGDYKEDERETSKEKQNIYVCNKNYSNIITSNF